MSTRRRTRPMETLEQKIGQDAPLEISTTGDASITKPEIEQVESHELDAKVFMEEPVKIIVHETTDPNDEPIPFVGVNGRNQYFIRGKEQTVKRKFVEVLARAKKTRYKTEITNDARGNVRQRLIPATGLRYPFSVQEDKNPNGGAWLKKILAEA